MLSYFDQIISENAAQQKGANFFLSGRICGPPGRIILKKSVGNIGKKAKNAGKFFYRPILKGNRQMLWYLLVN
jgi:hypothetical protein